MTQIVEKNPLRHHHATIERLANQLAAATILRDSGDDVTKSMRRIARGLQYVTEALFEGAGDILLESGEWVSEAQFWAIVPSIDKVPVRLRDDVPRAVRDRWTRESDAMPVLQQAADGELAGRLAN